MKKRKQDTESRKNSKGKGKRPKHSNQSDESGKEKSGGSNRHKRMAWFEEARNAKQLRKSIENELGVVNYEEDDEGNMRLFMKEKSNQKKNALEKMKQQLANITENDIQEDDVQFFMDSMNFIQGFASNELDNDSSQEPSNSQKSNRGSFKKFLFQLRFKANTSLFFFLETND